MFSSRLTKGLIKSNLDALRADRSPAAGAPVTPWYSPLSYCALDCTAPDGSTVPYGLRLKRYLKTKIRLIEERRSEEDPRQKLTDELCAAILHSHTPAFFPEVEVSDAIRWILESGGRMLCESDSWSAWLGSRKESMHIHLHYDVLTSSFVLDPIDVKGRTKSIPGLAVRQIFPVIMDIDPAEVIMTAFIAKFVKDKSLVFQI